MIVQVPGLRRALLLVAGCALAAALRAQAPEVPAGAEAVSMFGEPLTEVPMSAGERQEREARYAEARTAAAARPDDVEAQIWLGRRAAYLGHIREAVDVFTRALARWPDDPRLLRHRGHRYITLRRFDLAVADLERASRLAARRPDEAEPDEIRSQAPGDTLRSNIWYHLGVAHYLAGEFAPALLAPGAAGDDPLDPAILRYGVGAWYLAEGKRDDAVRIDREVLALGQWHSFAHIAAEADLRRLGEGAHPAAATRSGSSSPAF